MYHQHFETTKDLNNITNSKYRTTEYMYFCAILYNDCVCVQVFYNEKDSGGPPSVQLADGEGILSVAIGALQKYTVYVLQVLAFTQIGDGPPSNPILLRTREDGRNSLSRSRTFCLIPDLSLQHFALHFLSSSQP